MKIRHSAVLWLCLSPALMAQVPETATLTPAFALERQELRAHLIPQRHTTIAAGLAARIQRVSVKEGERFEQGQILVEFDCAQQTAQLNKANAQLASANNQHRGNQHLAEHNAIGQVELRNTEMEVAKARADLAYLQELKKQCQILAPFNGRAGEIKARELQFTQLGQALLELIDDSALELEFRVPSRWLSWLKADYAFEVFIDETDRAYPAKLLRTAARVDPVSQSVKAIAVIHGDFPELMAGMSGRILLTAPNKN